MSRSWWLDHTDDEREADEWRIDWAEDERDRGGDDER